MFGSKVAWASRKEGDRVVVGPVAEQVAYEDGADRVFWNVRNIKFRRRGITQKKT